MEESSYWLDPSSITPLFSILVFFQSESSLFLPFLLFSPSLFFLLFLTLSFSSYSFLDGRNNNSNDSKHDQEIPGRNLVSFTCLFLIFTSILFSLTLLEELFSLRAQIHASSSPSIFFSATGSGLVFWMLCLSFLPFLSNFIFLPVFSAYIQDRFILFFIPLHLLPYFLLTNKEEMEQMM